jgi:hypothetical protein
MMNYIRWFYMAFIFGTASHSNLVFGQSAEDWALAAKGSGCFAIVTEDEREECISMQADMKVLCERGDLTCRDLAYKQLKSDREKTARDLKQKNEDENKEDVDDLEHQLSKLDSQLSGAKSEAARRQEINDDCATAKLRVMKLFDDSVNRAEAQRSLNSNAAFRSDIDKVVATMEASIPGHATQHDQATKRAAECRDIMND